MIAAGGLWVAGDHGHADQAVPANATERANHPQASDSFSKAGDSAVRPYFCDPIMATKTATSTQALQDLPLIDEEESRQFVMVVSGHRARMEYDRTSDRIFLTHLLVPPALEGQDVASVLTEKVFTWIESKGMKLVPYCPFVKTYLRRHAAWQKLLVKGVQI